ncbi:MAG: hypothetical protein NWE83_09810 [Candidatus Bathyarchaeota archaeon]|nr:hypothetical protein [Candidatus Bathyarchaeota archaeon]
MKDSVKDVLQQYRVGMMLFLDDLHLQVGAYHQVGTNNIVMNRVLLEVVESTIHDPLRVNAFIYHILLHEYLHAVGYINEREVKSLVRQVSKACFGTQHVVTQLANAGPWSILQNIPLRPFQVPKRMIEIVKDFDSSNQNYIA